MPAFLVHVGPHKTGTTYLQLRLAAARDRLRAQGVSYPDIWDSAPGEPSHRKLVVSLREARVDDLRAQFDAIRRDQPEYILISAEGIGHLDQPALELLASLIGGDPVTIIYYCRRWSEILPSLWQETIKHGDDDTFPEFLAAHLADPTSSPVLNFVHALNRYAGVFGRSNVALLSYSTITDRDVDLADHFLESFLPRCRDILTNLPPAHEPRPNQSRPARDIEIIRALNSFSWRDGLPRGSHLRDWIGSQGARFDLTALHAAVEANMATLRFSDASAAPRMLHERISAAWHDRLLPPSQPGSLFEPRTADIRFVRSRYLTDTTVHKQLAEIYAAFRKAASLA